MVYPFPRPFSRFFLFTVARRMHPIDPRPFVLRQRPGPDWLGSGPEHEGLRWQHEPLPPRGVLRLQRAYGLPVPACTCRVLRPLPHVQVFCASFSPACLRRPVCVWELRCFAPLCGVRSSGKGAMVRGSSALVRLGWQPTVA